MHNNLILVVTCSFTLLKPLTINPLILKERAVLQFFVYALIASSCPGGVVCARQFVSVSYLLPCFSGEWAVTLRPRFEYLVVYIRI